MVRIGNSNIINNKIIKVNFNDELYSFIKLLKISDIRNWYLFLIRKRYGSTENTRFFE